jgi:hypothetical protein
MMHAAQTPAGDELQFALTRRTLAAANNLRAFAASSLEQIDTQSNRAAKLVCFFNPPPQMHSPNSHKAPMQTSQPENCSKNTANLLAPPPGCFSS